MKGLSVILDKLFWFTKYSCDRLIRQQRILFCTLCAGICFAGFSVCMAQSQSSVEHLWRLTENNATWIGRVIGILSWLSALFFAAFVSVIVFVIYQLIQLAKEVNKNKDLIQRIEQQKTEIFSLAKQVENVRDQIREQTLRSQRLSDEDFAKFVVEVLGWKVNMPNINSIKNFVVNKFNPGEYTQGLEKLKTILSDKKTMEEIKREYESAFKESINNYTLVEWAYSVKEKNKKLEDLIYEKAQDILKPLWLESIGPLFMSSARVRQEAEKIVSARKYKEGQ